MSFSVHVVWMDGKRADHTVDECFTTELHELILREYSGVVHTLQKERRIPLANVREWTVEQV